MFTDVADNTQNVCQGWIFCGISEPLKQLFQPSICKFPQIQSGQDAVDFFAFLIQAHFEKKLRKTGKFPWWTYARNSPRGPDS